MHGILQGAERHEGGFRPVVVTTNKGWGPKGWGKGDGGKGGTSGSGMIKGKGKGKC